MTDFGLLELAAKAAGYNIRHMRGGLGYFMSIDSINRWNPLEDDGDALRLAVNLDLTIYRPGSHPAVLVRTDDAETTYSDTFVRRAIVIAAASIGRAMA